MQIPTSEKPLHEKYYEWWLIPQVVANTSSGCLYRRWLLILRVRVVANCNEWLLISRVEANQERLRGQLAAGYWIDKIGIWIDSKTIEFLYLGSYWKYSCCMNSQDCLLVGSVVRSVSSRSVLKVRGVTLPCSYRSTDFHSPYEYCPRASSIRPWFYNFFRRVGTWIAPVGYSCVFSDPLD